MSRLADVALGAPGRAPKWAALGAWGLLGLASGAAIAIDPRLALIPVALLAAVPLIVSSHVRLMVVVFGALFTFQTSDELTGPKLAYLFALMVAVGAAVLRLPQLIGSSAYRDLKPLLRASVVTLLVIGVSYPVAHLNGILFTAWVRDVAPYVMVAFAPPLALDAQASMSARALRRTLVIAGTLGALGFTARWLTNRQIADLSFVPIGLPTLLLGATVFAVGMSVLVCGTQRRIAWGVLTGLVFAMLLATGTRTTLVLVAAPVAIVLASTERLRTSLRLAAVLPLIAVFVVLATQGILHGTSANREALAARIEVLFSTAEGEQDRSYLDRLSQNAASWELFRSSPVFGVGPGTSIQWFDSFNRLKESTVVDSPLSLIAKFGVFGLVAAIVLAIGYMSSLRRLRARTHGVTVTQLALVGYGAIVLAWSLLQNPYEDKGLAIGLLLLLAVAVREATDSVSQGAQTARRSLHVK